MEPGTRPRHVLFPYVGNSLGGGSHVSSAILIEQLSTHHDWRVTACLPHSGPNIARFRDAGAEVTCLDISERLVREIRHTRLRNQFGLQFHLHHRALEHLSRMRPGLIHVNDDMTMLSWGTAARRLGIPVVWHVRQEQRLKIDPLYQRIASKIIFIAHSTRSRLPSEGPPKAVVIHNASDTVSFHPPSDRAEAKRIVGLDPEKLSVGFVGRLSPVKRPEWVVEAGIELLGRGLDAQFVIVGPDRSDGYYDGVLPRRIRESGVPDNAIEMLGFRHDIPSIMRALDILLLPSIAEPFGLVVTEAMASGVAVIATDAGGVPEIIDHEETGLLSPANDYRSFVGSLHRLLTDHDLRRKIAKAGTTRVRERFTPERVTSEVLDVYESLL